jgi:hypothetical protein
MFFFFFPEIAEALKSDGSFMNLLRRDAHFKKGKDKISFFFHPDVDTLHEYVLGSLSDEKIREVMKHLSACEECTRKVIEIRRLDKEIAKDLRDWMKSSPSDAKGSDSDAIK